MATVTPARPIGEPAFDEPAPLSEGRWSSRNISVHWFIVGLLGLQIITQNWMSVFYERSEAGLPPGGWATFMGYAHMVVGTSIFGLMLIRMYDLWKVGRPDHDPREPTWSVWLASANHWAFYAILLAMPVAGALAYFLKIDWLGTIHGWAGIVLAALVVLHITGAFVSHGVFKAVTLKRKMPGQGKVPADVKA